MKALDNTDLLTKNLFIVNDNPTIDSRKLADIFGRQHKNVLSTLGTLIEDNTISRLESKPRNYTKRGKKERCYELNEAGFLKAMPFIGGRKSREGQKLLVDEFIQIKKLLTNQSKKRESIAFQLMRSEGKDARKLLTDAISELVFYAEKQGSHNAKNYYTNITKLAYNNFLIVEPRANNIRELLTPVQLSQLATFELLTEQIIRKGIEDNQPYKDIYQQIKKTLAKHSLNRTKLLEGD